MALRVVAGLNTDPENPGFKRALMRPQPGGGLTYARAEYKSVYGKIAIKWAIKDGNMVVDVMVPHNTTAHLVLPYADSEAIVGDNVEFTSCPGGCQAEIGSGTYSFTYPYKVIINRQVIYGLNIRLEVRTVEYLGYFYQCILIGFSGAMMPGPLLGVTIEGSLKGDT